MATIILSAAGAAAGAAAGGSAFGLSSVVIGRAVGATLGRVIDQQILGGGAETVETGRIDEIRITGASEGAPIARVQGRARLPGQVIWASDFLETKSTADGGKSSPEMVSFSYSVSLAIALCEGEIARLGRIWADGIEQVPADLPLRVYHGTEDQLPDPKMEAVEGEGQVPAYRGIAYVVFEDLELAPFGNRVPQFTFEVVRPVPDASPAEAGLGGIVPGVALIPGTGEYALATTEVGYSGDLGETRPANTASASGLSDFATSLDILSGDLPSAGSVLLVVSWFGLDLRCDQCALHPRVEQKTDEGSPMPWRVSGLSRDAAGEVVRLEDGSKAYGGTPADESVLEAIAALKAAGKAVVFYPFILMEQLDGNTLTDPYTGEPGQPALPWRGRITTSLAPGVDGSPDATAAAEAEVDAFFGQAAPGDFAFDGQTVQYSGPAEWSLRRMILHYAHLCAAAGGVDGFCIGTEMRELTRIRGAGGSYPAVAALRALAADCRSVLGPDAALGYAADWSEYANHRPDDGSGDVIFHLDPLWADDEIDFIGIDNYMPLSDWRDGEDHADARWGAIHDIDYLKANIEGGEHYDWYYRTDEAARLQLRTPIADTAHGEDWVFRVKDIRNWWANTHHDRPGGVRSGTPTPWVPGSKPVWFTEFGCPAVDKGTNQPNKFIDPKSSESALPRASRGTRDDLIQAQYLRAMLAYWADPANNPVSDAYQGRMIDLARAHVWAWDARPFPQFPALDERWSDGDNYALGHWLNGRAEAVSLGAAVREICARAGLEAVETARLFGLVRGRVGARIESARAALQPLMLAHSFDAAERDGAIDFRSRTGRLDGEIPAAGLAVTDAEAGDIERIRTPEAETAGRVRVSFIETAGDYETRTAEAIFPGEVSRAVAGTELSMMLTQAEGGGIAERMLSEARVARDRANFALPLSRMALGAGDVVSITGTGEAPARYRIERVELGEQARIEAARVEPGIYVPSDGVEMPVSLAPFVPPVPVLPVFLDLPLITGAEVAHAPRIAATATPWPGSVAVYSATEDAKYPLNVTFSARGTIGVTETALAAAPPALWDRGAPLRVRMAPGTALTSRTGAEVLNGANLMAIGDGSAAGWELFQFTDATLVGADTYELTGRLRGQLGTETLMPAAWPPGSRVVLIDSGAATQIALSLSERGLARHYRIGPAGRPRDDPAYTHRVEAFDGAGLRPYAPVHLRAARRASGDLDLGWIRRTRIDGDSWASVEVPLGEDAELYELRVLDGAGAIIRTRQVTSPAFTYTAADQAADAIAPPFAVEVAQISQSYGPGPFARIDIDD